MLLQGPPPPDKQSPKTPQQQNWISQNPRIFENPLEQTLFRQEQTLFPQK